MSETRQDDPWATVRTFAQTRTGLWPSDSGRWYCRTEVDAARAAEATQHQQDRRRWAESLKDQHQRHVIESEALRKVLAAWEITANERSACLATLRAERDRLKAALSQLDDWLRSFSMPPTSTIAEKEAALVFIAAALSGEGTAKP